MFQVGNPVLSFFQMALGISSSFGLDVTNKSIRFSEASPYKGFEFVPGQKGKSVVLHMSLVLLPPIENALFEEIYSKRVALVSWGPSWFKMILVLLNKVVVFHMQVTIIQVGILIFDRPIKIVYRIYWSLVFSLFDVGLYELSEKHISRGLLRSRKRLRVGGYQTCGKSLNGKSYISNKRHSGKRKVTQIGRAHV